MNISILLDTRERTLCGTWNGLFDEKRSVARYTRMVKEAVTAAYPDADVTITSCDIDFIRVNMPGRDDVVSAVNTMIATIRTSCDWFVSVP
jgi:hypothetical protein